MVFMTPLDPLPPHLYSELKALAQNHLRAQRAGHTLQPTALVHEAFLKLASADSVEVNDRNHFLALYARAMRFILLDHARRRHALRRGGDLQRVTLSAVGGVGDGMGIDVLALNETLEKLEAVDEQHARIVELRFFCGLSVPEVADVLGCSRSTVEAEWRVIRARLIRELGSGDGS